MGWFDWAGFGSDSSTALKPARSSDGGFIAPDRNARATCWQGRDKFFACLDQHDILDSVKEDGKARQLCGAELREFEKVCAKTWVTYFKQRRVFEYKKDLAVKEMEEQNAKMAR